MAMDEDDLADELYTAIKTELGATFGGDFDPSTAEQGLRAICRGVASAVITHITTNARTSVDAELIE